MASFQARAATSPRAVVIGSEDLSKISALNVSSVYLLPISRRADADRRGPATLFDLGRSRDDKMQPFTVALTAAFVTVRLGRLPDPSKKQAEKKPDAT